MTVTPDNSLMKRARADMKAGQFAGALATLDAVLSSAPEDTEALYMAAVCARYLKRFGEAENRLERLTTLAPELGRAWQEAGHLARDRGETDTALSAYRYACQLNPALEASWRAQADLLKASGADRDAAAALAQADRLRALPKPLVSVTHLLSEGKLAKAEGLCREFLKANPTHTEGMRLLADIAVRLGILEDAEILLENAVRFEPDNIQLRLDFIQVLRKRQKFSAALAEAEALHARDPANPLFQSHLAIERMQTGDFAGALELFDGVLETLPGDPATLTSRGHALKTWGRQEAAIESYQYGIFSGTFESKWHDKAADKSAVHHVGLIAQIVFEDRGRENRWHAEDASEHIQTLLEPYPCVILPVTERFIPIDHPDVLNQAAWYTAAPSPFKNAVTVDHAVKVEGTLSE